MQHIILLAKLISSMLGTSFEDWACWESMSNYVPRDGTHYECYYDGGTDSTRVYMDWDDHVHIGY